MSNAATFTIGAETANAHNVGIQLGSRSTRGGALRNLGSARVVDAYLSSDSAGAVPVNPFVNDAQPTAGATGVIVDKPITGTKASFTVKTNAAGHADVVLTNASNTAFTTYLNLVLNGGKVVTSPAITFA